MWATADWKDNLFSGTCLHNTLHNVCKAPLVRNSLMFVVNDCDIRKRFLPNSKNICWGTQDHHHHNHNFFICLSNSTWYTLPSEVSNELFLLWNNIVTKSSQVMLILCCVMRGQPDEWIRYSRVMVILVLPGLINLSYLCHDTLVQTSQHKSWQIRVSSQLLSIFSNNLHKYKSAGLRHDSTWSSHYIIFLISEHNLCNLL